MPYAYVGKLLSVDLTTGAQRSEPLNLDYARKFIGGKGLAARYLFDLLKPGTDPLSPENVFIIMTGPLTGTMAPASAKYCVVTKSPLTNIWLDTHAGGYFGPELKYAGLDGVIITGRAKEPVYLYIEDGTAQIRDAKGVWGKTTSETDTAIKEELGDNMAVVMCIGPAGEKLVKLANISSCYRQHGRGGAGAVMGSKNLKAVAVRGSGGVTVAYPEEFLKACQEVTRKHICEDPNAEFGIKWGSPSILWWTQESGTLPTRNYQDGQFEGVPKIDATAVLSITTKRHACEQCPICCSNYVTITSGPYAGTKVDGPEYETLTFLGADLGIDRLDAIAKAHLLCDEFGLDAMSTGATIAFAMECYERGILTPKETEGIELKFGNHEALLAMIEKIGKREGLGNILAEGSARAAKTIGKGSERYTVHVKGLELAAYDPRGSPAMGLCYATADRGGCHLRGWPIGVEAMGSTGSYWMGPALEIDRWGTKNKAQLVANQQNNYYAKFSLEICDFGIWEDEPMSYLLWTATGFDEYRDVNAFELAGERIVNMTRVINVREGVTAKDDTLPTRIFEDPVKTGPAKGHVVKREDFKKMLDEYYTLRRWDSEGRPTAKRLEEIDMKDVALRLPWIKPPKKEA